MMKMRNGGRNVRGLVRRVFVTAIVLGIAITTSNLMAKGKRKGKGTRVKVPVTSIENIPRDKVICFALYTLHKDILKITGQLYPLNDDETTKVKLEIMKDGNWKTIQEKKVLKIGCTVPFKIENWDSTKDPKEINNLWYEPSAKDLKAEQLLKFAHAEMEKEPLPMPRITCA